MGILFNNKPPITEKNLADQTGKVFIVTGSSGGIGLALAQILYAHNARVYIAARSRSKANDAIESIKSTFPNSNGSLVFLQLDLGDLTTIKASAEEFLSKEKQLHILFNNAGVMMPPQGSKTAQGYELQLGTNCVGTFAFTKLLTPLIVKTAKQEPAGSVRVLWVASSAAQRMSPTDGVNMGNLDYKNDQSALHKYGVSKAGNILHGAEFARRYGKDGVVSVPLDPGNLNTDLYRTMPGWQKSIVNFILHDSIYGAYTELYGGFSPDLSAKNNGAFVEPWGGLGKLRSDLQASCKTVEEGGSGVGLKFWDWSEEQVKAYV